MKYILLHSLSALLLISLLFACHKKSEGENAKGFALTDTMMNRITIDSVTERMVTSELRFSGKVTPEENKMTTVYPVVSGYVTKVNVSLGDYVQKGQVLAKIRSTDIAEFEKQLRSAETELLVAKKTLKASQELFESRLNTQKDVDAAAKEVETAEAELSRVREVFNIYNIQKGAYFNVTAPISGFVIAKNINADMQLPAGFSESLFSIAQIDEVFVTANAYETDIAKLALNMPAEIEFLSYPGQRFHGKIDKILNVLDPVTRTLKIRIRLPNPGYMLKPDMAATVFITRNETETRPAVASEALVFDKSKYYVMIFHRQDSIETRMVEPLRTTGQVTYLTGGLAPGEKIISKNALLVYDAMND